jgi:hypothetical protein
MERSLEGTDSFGFSITTIRRNNFQVTRIALVRNDGFLSINLKLSETRVSGSFAPCCRAEDVKRWSVGHLYNAKWDVHVYRRYRSSGEERGGDSSGTELIFTAGFPVPIHVKMFV